MRIFRAEEDCVYIQIEDIRYIGVRGDIKTPRTLLKQVWESGYPSINDDNKNAFIKIEDDDLIDFIMKLNCLIDYDEIRNMSIKKLGEIHAFFSEEQEKEKARLISANQSERESLLVGINDLEHKQYQLQNFILYKNGINGIDSFILPEGIEYPTKGRSLKYILDKIRYDKEHKKAA